VGLKYAILATEGADDQAVLCRLLRLSGLESFNGERKYLDPFWTRLIPSSKKLESNLYGHKKVHMPYFFMSSTHSIAVYQGQGSNLAQNLQDIMTAYQPYARDIYALGVLVDADNRQPDTVAALYADKLRGIFPTISRIAGTIVKGSPHTGIYVLPDNKRPGTLDTALVNCAATMFPDHKSGAEQFLNNLDDKHKERWPQPFGQDKALVASVVSVLQPGKANHMSLASDRDGWICRET
jgi:hypothetical protein